MKKIFKYRCIYCGKRFSRIDWLRKHKVNCPAKKSKFLTKKNYQKRRKR